MSESLAKFAASAENRQFSTFFIGDRLFGIDVMLVQEITRSLSVTPIPHSPQYVRGLVNLRGQLATAIELRSLFEIERPAPNTGMNVVCRLDGVLLSFLVDNIGDVVDAEGNAFEETPDTVTDSIRQFMSGVYKIPGQLLSIIDVSKVLVFLNSKGTR